MIRSMTAFARQESQTSSGPLGWELRSVNHRYLETYLRLPDEFRVIESKIRELLAQRLGRGKVDLTLRFQGSIDRSGISIDTKLAQEVIAAANQIEAMLENSTPISPLDVLRWPGVMVEPVIELEPIQAEALKLLETAISELIETREREGARLAEIVTGRLEELTACVQRVAKRQPQVVALQRQKFLDRLGELAEQAEPGRLEQELAIQAQKLDIAEELDRLNTHLDEVRRTLQSSKPVGRRLDFLMQELNREANTIGSKSADSAVTQCSVEMKVLIEQMREQVQNIE